MKFSNTKGFLLVLLLIFSLPTTAGGMPGKSDDSGFYPESQAYIIADAKFDNISKIAKDLRGIPTILRGSTIYFTEKYFTLKNINSGSTNVIGSCFEQIGNMLIIKPAGRFSKSFGKEITLWKMDSQWVMPYGENLKLQLKEAPLPEDFSEVKRRLDLAYNSLIKKGYGRDNYCKLTEVSDILLTTKNYTLAYKDLGGEKIVIDGILDPDTPINSGYMSYANRIKLNENINLDGCNGNILMYRYASGRHNRFNSEKAFFYIVSVLSGKRESDNKYCSKVKELKKVYMDNISIPYNVTEKYGSVSFGFSRWEGNYGLVVRHTRSKRDFLISGLNLGSMNISEIPYQEDEK